MKLKDFSIQITGPDTDAVVKMFRRLGLPISQIKLVTRVQKRRGTTRVDGYANLRLYDVAANNN